MFTQLARKSSYLVGTAGAFVAAVLLVVVWALMGPLFSFSSTWQLVINTTTTIITFLIVFLIQHAQNADVRAVHLKLDELILALDETSNTLVELENQTQAQVDNVVEEHKKRL